MSDLDGEWLEALEVDPADNKEEDSKDDIDTSADDDTDNDTDTNEEKKDESDDGKDDDAASDDKAEEQDDEKDEKEGVNDEDDNNSKDDTVKSDAQKEPATTKEVVKEAIQEIEASKLSRSESLESIKKEVEETLYPDGIDRQLRDSDGDPITGIDDLTKLINPNTNENFTEEEAGRWLLAAQKKLNEDVETIEHFIEEVADTTQSLTEGAERVATKYSEILSQDVQMKDRLLAAYQRTLVKDPATGVVIKAPIGVEEFFDLALEPTIAQRTAQIESEKKAAEAKKKAAKASQQERGDLKPSGKAEKLNPTDKEWATAIKEYEEGV